MKVNAFLQAQAAIETNAEARQLQMLHMFQYLDAGHKRELLTTLFGENSYAEYTRDFEQNKDLIKFMAESQEHFYVGDIQIADPQAMQVIFEDAFDLTPQ